MVTRSSVGLVGMFLFAQACGGSSSETPMPLEPVPHRGPEPAVQSAPPAASAGGVEETQDAQDPEASDDSVQLEK